ncbi:MAG: PilN domain-containing protein, partial [Candidatus Omnitrophica bacterium]|nr:PilN domain-containing protein [Candidatus Omnitrophota bacterium]
ERLDVKAESLSSQARTLEKASTKIRVLRNSIGYRGKGLYVFDKVVSLFGPDSYLSSFSYDPEGNIILLGTSETMSGVFALVTKFESSGLFSSVTTQETKTRKEGGKEVADFDLKCQLNQEI